MAETVQWRVRQSTCWPSISNLLFEHEEAHDRRVHPKAVVERHDRLPEWHAHRLPGDQASRMIARGQAQGLQWSLSIAKDRELAACSPLRFRPPILRNGHLGSRSSCRSAMANAGHKAGRQVPEADIHRVAMGTAAYGRLG
jgi:hypothetical protein